jgi:hypothetical protein
VAYTYNFTVTQVVNSFTATLTTPLSLALTNTPDSVLIYKTTATVSVTNNIQPVTIIGAGAGAGNFNQSLNTFDNVSFDTVATSELYGAGGQPVTFPNGINVPNAGTVFINTIDFGPIV